MPRYTIHPYVSRKPIYKSFAAKPTENITHKPIVGAATTKLAGDAGNLPKQETAFRKINANTGNPLTRKIGTTFRKILPPSRKILPSSRKPTFRKITWNFRKTPVDTAMRITKYESKGEVRTIKHKTIPKRPSDIEVVRNVSQLRKKRGTARSKGKRIALVPTMGALHRGHVRLIRNAALSNDEVYVSIYVNPTQFGIHEDLDNYPQTWEKDLKRLNALNAHMINRDEFRGQVTTVFKPSTAVMYPGIPPTSTPDGHGSFINITPLSNVLEGASRPVFFRGVATVVMKLLNIVQPDEVFFGQKDIQQVLVIRRLIMDFHINTVMRIVHTVRERDGLAMSSRNVNLGARRRAVATVLWQALEAARAAVNGGKRTRDEILEAAIEVAAKVQQVQRYLPPSERARFEVDYLSLADPDNLMEVQVVENGKPVILSGAVIMLPLEDPQRGENAGPMGGATAVRLIDNIIFFRDKMFPQGSGKSQFLVKPLDGHEEVE